MAANPDAIKTLSNAELLRYFKILFKNAPFINTAIPSKNQEYTVSTGAQVGHERVTETGDFAVIFFTGKYYHELGAIHSRHSLMAVRTDQIDQVTIPNSCKEVLTVDHDDHKWKLYEDPTKPGFPSNHLRDEKERELTKCIVFLTPNNLRKVIESEIFHAEVDFGRLQKKIKASQQLATELAEAMAVLEKLPGNLLPESLNTANPDTLTSLAESLREISATISPEGPEGLESQGVMSFVQNKGLQGGAG